MPIGRSHMLAAVLIALVIYPSFAQDRPKVVWTEPGDPPAYGFLSLAPDGTSQEAGEAASWRWVSIAPNGKYAIYVPPNSPHPRVRNLVTGFEAELARVRHDAGSQIRKAVWAGSALWLVVLEDGTRNALYAVDPAVPTSTPASGRYSIASFTPVEGAQVAYAVASQGPASEYQDLMLCHADGTRPRVLGDRQLVVGGRIIEEAGRIAYFSKRPDRAGLVLNVYDRTLDEEFRLNPEAEAFLPVFAPGFEAAAYTTSRGIVYHALGGDPHLLMEHPPDRRYALSYQFTPGGDSLLVEIPANPERTARRLIRIDLDAPDSPATVMEVPADPEGEASGITYLPDGGGALVVVPQADGQAPDGVYLVDLARAEYRMLGAGTLADALAAPSGRALAMVMAYPQGLEPDQAAIVVVDPSAPEAPLRRSLTVQGTTTEEGLSLRGLSMAFAPGDDRLLVKGIRAGGTRPQAFVIPAPGAPAEPVPGDFLVHEARWARSGETLLLSAIVGYTAARAPLLSLLAVDAANPAGSERLLSGSHRITDVYERPDGGLTAVVEARKATRKLLVSTQPEERLVLAEDLAASGPVWSPDGARLLFGEQVAPGYSAVYAASPGVEPILMSGEVLVREQPAWLSDGQGALLLAPSTQGESENLMGFVGHAAGGAPRPLGPMGNATLIPGADTVLYRAPGPPEGIYSLDLADPSAVPVLLGEGYEAAIPAPMGGAYLLFREVENGLRAAAGRPGATLQPLPGAYRELVWAGNGSALAAVTAGEPGILQVFSPSGELLGSAEATPSAVAFSPQGDRLAGIVEPIDGPPHTVLWSLAGEELARIRWPASMKPLSALASSGLGMLLPTSAPPLSWSPDGTRSHVVGLSEDGLLEIRTLLWEEQANMPSAFSGSVSDLAWSPGAGHLAALTYRLTTAPEEGLPAEPPRRLVVTEGHAGRTHNVAEGLSPDGFTWLPDGRLAFWCSEGLGPEARGTFVVNPDGTGRFRIAPYPGVVWPRAPRPARAYVEYTPGRTEP